LQFPFKLYIAFTFMHLANA